MPKVLSKGIQLHYEEMGSGPETIVFSHSYLADHTHYNPHAICPLSHALRITNSKLRTYAV
jgi:hypothetical protein